MQGAGRVARAAVAVVVAAVSAVAVASCAAPPRGRPSTSAGPTGGAQSTETTGATVEALPADPRVGAIFLDGRTVHVCSGSVLDTASGQLILTAAHCLAEGIDTFFVPGFADDAAPEDFWRVDAVYLDPRWLQHQDPLADFAIARVSRDGPETVQQRAGGGFRLGGAAARGTPITVHGYAFGVGGGQLGCRARAALHGEFPMLPCEGLVGGTSGSPWVSGSTVTGIVGGLEGGGCEENVSYSPPFGAATAALLARAEAGGAGDAAPTVFDDGC